ncbi:MAG: hypothetical protein MZV64_23165 [Ignavibacteriales bacterium]|nr:hypothetical protein [Ignavibacteriales bacterium]
MKIEKIKFERTGGSAGIRLAAEIEMDELSEEQRREILEMLDEMDFEELSDKFTSEVSFPDGFVYAISVESEKRNIASLQVNLRCLMTCCPWSKSLNP